MKAVTYEQYGSTEVLSELLVPSEDSGQPLARGEQPMPARSFGNEADLAGPVTRRSASHEPSPDPDSMARLRFRDARALSASRPASR